MTRPPLSESRSSSSGDASHLATPRTWLGSGLGLGLGSGLGLGLGLQAMPRTAAGRRATGWGAPGEG
eukprot:scaffold52102_cov56-Phaeocystis_antarctica.AAC.2